MTADHSMNGHSYRLPTTNYYWLGQITVTELVDVKVFYLEMTAPNERQVAAPCDGLLVLPVEKPGLGYYRFLYDQIGRDYHWLSRRKLADAELAALLKSPDNQLYVLHVDGNPAGMAELDRSRSGQVELVQFGLLPEFIGRGLGVWFLQWTIDRVWRDPIRRFWLHTCTLDHDAALPNYQRAGFAIYREETIRREL